MGPLLPRMAILPGLNLMEKILSGLEEGERIDDYVIVSVEMGKIKLELNGRVVKLILLPENAQSVN